MYAFYGEFYTTNDCIIKDVVNRTDFGANTIYKNDILFPPSTTVDADSLISPACLNDRKPNNRIRFTVAHELGHIESGHLYKINCLGLTMNAHYDNDSQSIFFENEANSFARNLLATLLEIINYLLKCGFNFTTHKGFPAVIHNQDPKINPASYLSLHFGLSKDAARIRVQLIRYDCKIYSMLHGEKGME